MTQPLLIGRSTGRGDRSQKPLVTKNGDLEETLIRKSAEVGRVSVDNKLMASSLYLPGGLSRSGFRSTCEV